MLRQNVVRLWIIVAMLSLEFSTKLRAGCGEEVVVIICQCVREEYVRLCVHSDRAEQPRGSLKVFFNICTVLIFVLYQLLTEMCCFSKCSIV